MGPESRVVEAPPSERADPEVVDEHVARRRERPENLTYSTGVNSAKPPWRGCSMKRVIPPRGRSARRG